MIPSNDTDYDRTPPISGKTGDFKWQPGKDQLSVDMKHPATESEAREVVDEYLRGWEITTGLFHRPGSLSFKYGGSIFVERPQGNEKKQSKIIESSERILLSDEIRKHTSYGNFPPPLEKFKESPEVEMMYLRYKLYREGRETLRGLAYWLLKVMVSDAGGREKALEQYRLDSMVFRKLTEL